MMNKMAAKVLTYKLGLGLCDNGKFYILTMKHIISIIMIITSFKLNKSTYVVRLSIKLVLNVLRRKVRFVSSYEPKMITSLHFWMKERPL